MKNQFNNQYDGQHTQYVFSDYRDLWNWNFNASESQDVIAPHTSNQSARTVTDQFLIPDSNHAINHGNHDVSVKFDGLVYAMASFAPHHGEGEMPYHAHTHDHGVQGPGVLSVDTFTHHGS